MLPVETRISDFIKEHHVLTLATSNDSESWCANCFYVYVKDEISFLFTSDIDTKHIQLALENPNVSGSIVLETKIVGKIRGIQFTGVIQQVAKNEYAKYKLKYLKKYPFAVLINTELWVVKIQKIKMTDNRLGFGKKLNWEREK